MGEQLGVAPTVEAMEGVAPARFVAAQQALSAESARTPHPARWGEITANAMLFEPVVDGEVLPALPLEAIAAGASADVDVLIGANRDEHRLFVVPPGITDTATDPMLDAVAGAYRLPAGALDAYRAVRPGASAGMVLADVMSDWFFRIPAIRLAEAHGRARVYDFDWPSPLFDGRLGACHALELAFAFDTLGTAGGLTGDNPPQALADAMHAAWVAFASTADPGWPVYADDRLVRRFAVDAVTTESDPRGDLRELWAAIR